MLAYIRKFVIKTHFLKLSIEIQIKESLMWLVVVLIDKRQEPKNAVLVQTKTFLWPPDA